MKASGHARRHTVARRFTDERVLALQQALAEQTRAREAAELALKAAQTAERARMQTLVRIVHDLRAPMQSTMSWMHLLRAAEDPAKRDLALERIQHNIDRHAQMLGELSLLAGEPGAPGTGRRAGEHAEPPPATEPAQPTQPGALHGEPRLSSRERAALRGLRVLYVEDAVDTAEVVRLMLSDLGMDVSVCHRFDEALERIRRGRFDVLLSDLYLDGLGNGLDLVRELRQLPPEQRVPAVLLSAYGEEEHRRASAAAGFSAHLTKPVDMTAVAHTLAKVVAKA
ncbi:ATP-binding response regulator [Ideonella sp. BN130291]|uniref:ATP-binding response regulator n=1 Tax=Ideonella sp. BN130291 TaxID=3112940 RepID=UPI002E26E100|nr:response regulator [Ideonella sp. BN130291]